CDGVDVRLERRPMDLLILLVERRGELVSREEIVNHIWGPDLFVEAEAGINTAIRKIRRVLQDIPKRPAYIETVPGRGYRFALPAGEPTASSQVRLAVVPVVSLDPSPERQYLADGLTEEVIAALGQVDPDHLSVIGRTSMMTYQGTSKSLSEIGQALGAEFLVESSMRADGEFVRITSRLVRAIDQTQLWCDSFDGERGSSVLNFQRELSVAIAQQVQSRLSSDRLNTIARRHPRQYEAYDLYLQGRYYWHQLSAETTRHAIEYYRRAVALAPDYGLAGPDWVA
ncbi:MAG: winged helix-turn-helix domain-containing protein, partial [Bryobacteraceae bacterium]